MEDTTEAMLMIDPSRRSRMAGRKAWMVLAMEPTLMRKLRSSSAASQSSTVPVATTPTQFTSTDVAGYCAASRATAAPSVTSTRAAVTPAADVQSVSGPADRSTATTVAPAAASPSAMARPMPCPAPVTMQVLSIKPWAMLCLSLLDVSGWAPRGVPARQEVRIRRRTGMRRRRPG
jgi:hypothetical protein